MSKLTPLHQPSNANHWKGLHYLEGKCLSCAFSYCYNPPDHLFGGPAYSKCSQTLLFWNVFHPQAGTLKAGILNQFHRWKSGKLMHELSLLYFRHVKGFIAKMTASGIGLYFQVEEESFLKSEGTVRDKALVWAGRRCDGGNGERIVYKEAVTKVSVI